MKEKCKRWLPEEESKGLVVKRSSYCLDTPSSGRQDIANPSRIVKQLMVSICSITVFLSKNMYKNPNEIIRSFVFRVRKILRTARRLSKFLSFYANCLMLKMFIQLLVDDSAYFCTVRNLMPKYERSVAHFYKRTNYEKIWFLFLE